MRQFILAVMAGIVAAVVYKTISNHPVLKQSPDATNGPVGSTTLTKLPTFSGVAAETGHGDAILNADPSIPYTPAFGAKTNRAPVEWVEPYLSLQAGVQSA